MYAAPPPTPPKSDRRRWLATALFYIVGFAAGCGAYAGLRALGLSPLAVAAVFVIFILVVAVGSWEYRRRRSSR